MTKRDTSMEFTVALTAADIAAFVREVGKARAPEGAEAEAPPLTERQKRVRRWIEVGHHIARLFVMFLVIWVKLDLDRLLDLYDPRSDKEKFTALLQGNWGPAPWDFIWLVDPLIPALAIFLYLWWALDRAKKALFKRWDLGDPNPYVTQAIAREEARKARVAALDDGAVPWVSVALSVGSRPPGVTWPPALWSPDFPPPASGGGMDAPPWPHRFVLLWSFIHRP
jgi:hypothetical protein